MSLITESLATTTLQDWQAGAPERNTSITQLCKQSNWALASAGGWQWQHGGRIVNTGTILSGAQWWPVVCAPFGAQRIRVSVFGSCSSGGTEQIGVYLSDSWPFGAGVQVGLLTLTGTGAVATCEIDTSVYFGACLIYLKAETNIDDLELQGFRGRCVAAEPAGTALELAAPFAKPRFVQQKEFADASPLTISVAQALIDVGKAMFNRRGITALTLSLTGGQVRNVEEWQQSTATDRAIVLSGVVSAMRANKRLYVRSFQASSSGVDSLVVRIDGSYNGIIDMSTTGTQTQSVWEGWELADFYSPGIGKIVVIDVLYFGSETADAGHIVQDVSLICMDN